MFNPATAPVIIAEAAGDGGPNVLRIVADADLVVTSVLILLAVMSVVSWYITGYKYFYIRRARRESKKFMDIFWQSKRLDSIYQSTDEFPDAPVSNVFRAGYLELSKLKNNNRDGDGQSMREQLGDIENVERALRRAQREELTDAESLIPWLASIGSTSPFIGLFGTVWGIMVAFLEISQQESAGIEVVGQPIAEALIVTAAGLFAAIPAVIAYNWLLNHVKVMGSEMDNFSSDFLNIVKRHFFD